jgi:hypothetical protein
VQAPEQRRQQRVRFELPGQGISEQVRLGCLTWQQQHYLSVGQHEQVRLGCLTWQQQHYLSAGQHEQVRPFSCSRVEAEASRDCLYVSEDGRL